MKTKPRPRAAPAKACSQGSGSDQVLGWWVLIDPAKVCTWQESHGHPVPPALPGTVPGPQGSASTSQHWDPELPAQLCPRDPSAGSSAPTLSSCAGHGIVFSHFTGTEGFSSSDAKGVPHSQPHSWHHPFPAQNKLLFCMR